MPSAPRRSSPRSTWNPVYSRRSACRPPLSGVRGGEWGTRLRRAAGRRRGPPHGGARRRRVGGARAAHRRATFLAYGTLLGALRERDLLEWSGDVDLTVSAARAAARAGRCRPRGARHRAVLRAARRRAGGIWLCATPRPGRRARADGHVGRRGAAGGAAAAAGVGGDVEGDGPARPTSTCTRSRPPPGAAASRSTWGATRRARRCGSTAGSTRWTTRRRPAPTVGERRTTARTSSRRAPSSSAGDDAIRGRRVDPRPALRRLAPCASAHAATGECRPGRVMFREFSNTASSRISRPSGAPSAGCRSRC